MTDNDNMRAEYSPAGPTRRPGRPAKTLLADELAAVRRELARLATILARIERDER